ncbi:hypothetical protein, partial [Enterococcus faecium]
GLTAGRNDEILTRWNLEKILTNRVRGIDSNPVYREGSIEKTVFWTKESGMSLAEVEEFLDYVSMQQ